jgi:hypothetical protein
MHVGKQAYLVAAMNSPTENRRINNIFVEAIASENAKDVTAAVIAVGSHIK